MNLKEYTAAAIETESRIPLVQVDTDYLLDVLNATIAAGNLLDVIKKDAFYGLPTNPVKAEQRAMRLIDNSTLLRRAAGAAEAGARAVQRGEPANIRPLTNINSRVAHAIIGLATESVELLEALRDAIYDDAPIDGVNVLEELGDLNWYHAIAVDALGGDWEQIQETNISKLRKRNQGNKFNAEATINRDEASERVLLETQLSNNAGNPVEGK